MYSECVHCAVQCVVVVSFRAVRSKNFTDRRCCYRYEPQREQEPHEYLRLELGVSTSQHVVELREREREPQCRLAADRVQIDSPANVQCMAAVSFEAVVERERKV